MHSPVGAISNTKNYILRFTTLGTNPNGIIRVYLRKTASPYTGLTAVQVKCFDNTIKNHEILFAAPVSDLGTSLVFEIEQNSGTTYLDNISFTEADATAFAIDDFLRLEYNASSTSKTIALGANYLGVDGTYYSGSITLQPFTSKILVKDTSIIRQALAVQTNADAISCFGPADRCAGRGGGPHRRPPCRSRPLDSHRSPIPFRSAPDGYHRFLRPARRPRPLDRRRVQPPDRAEEPGGERLEADRCAAQAAP